MKNKIKQFAKGDFKLQRPDIVFHETHLLITVSEGETYQGVFTMEDKKGGTIRGLVYSSSFRVQCLEQGFEGNPVQIHFTYDSTGMKPGEMEKGKFTIVCNGGEFDLTYSLVVEKPFILTKYGKIQNITDFKKLASQDFLEARKLFRTRQFYDVLKYEDLRVRNLYDNMRTWSLDEQALEEFLVGIKLKEKLFLTVDQDKISYKNIMEDGKGRLDITKNTWGYATIRIDTQGDFLHVTQKHLTTDDFIGNHYHLEYFVKKDRLHAGNNYGKILIATPYETLTIDLCVHQQVEKDAFFGSKGLIAGQGLKDYLLCLSGKMEVDVWMEKATQCVKKLRELEPNNEYYMLLQAHIYLRGRRDEEARWILENGNFGKFTIGRNQEISVYYHFLLALLKKDSTSALHALDEANRLYMKRPYSWPLLCMIIHLDPKYKDYNDRLRVLERQYFNGSNQVLLYAEAYLCFQEKVLLLRKLDSFEIQILNFATKYHMITKELALYAAELIGQQKKYNGKLVAILERIYAMYEDERVLHALCTQLIKGNKIGQKYFHWYELAVKSELKIAQLYEYYMMSMKVQRQRGAFPRIVYLYFLHGIHLDYQRTALLYENILTYETEDSEIYQAYKEQMMAFAKEQLLKRHINSSLRILYNRFLNENNMGLDELDALYDICHKYHVTTTNPDMKYVLVIEQDGTVRQRVAYTEDGANVYLYDKAARIVWEAKDGCHYTDSVSYDAVRLFYELRFMEMCKKRMSSQVRDAKEKRQIALSFENLRTYGLACFDDEEIFLLCTKRIRERENVEDDFLLYTSFAMFEKNIYDKVLLHYLAHYFCGPTSDMKRLWRVANEYGVKTQELAERIITQMLFSEVMSQESTIFEDYYVGKPYFRLKQAYLAFVANQYVIENRELSKNIFAIMMREFREQEYLADICKVAILKFFSSRERDAETEATLQGYLREMCEKKLIFAFYQEYPKSWLREVQLFDKYIVEYHAISDGKVKLVYQLNDGKQMTESLAPAYANTYIKEFVLYADEQLHYHFIEEAQEQVTTSERMHYMQVIPESIEGRYGRLNQMGQLAGIDRQNAMLQYRQEVALAQEVFQMY